MTVPTAVRYTGLPPSRAFPFPAITGASLVTIHGAGLFTGYGIENTSNVNPARLVVGDGGEAGIGTEIVPLTFAANESRLDTLTNGGILFETGLVVTATLGTLAGAVYAILLSPDELRALREFSVSLPTDA